MNASEICCGQHVPIIQNDDDIIWALNEALVLKRIPAICFVVILALVGSVGNGLVFVVYRTQLKKSTVNVFIFWLSVFDFSLCFFEMPYKAFEMRFPLMYGYSVMCKGFSFVEIFLSMVSIIILLCIAFDRYFVVMRPLKRLTLENINKIVCLCIGLGVLFSWPTLFVYGQSRKPTSAEGVFGWGCGIATEMARSKLVPYWYYFLYAVFVVSCIILVYMYVRIWMSIKRWKYTIIGESMTDPHSKMSITVSVNTSSFSSRHSSGGLKYKSSVEIPSTQQTTVNADQSESSFDIASSSTSTAVPVKPVISCELGRSGSSALDTSQAKTATVKHARMRRNTMIFGAIALVFVLSYLPILTIIFLRTSGLYNMSQAPLWQAQLFEVCHRSGYINNAVNPFIYAFLSPWFRLQVRKMFQ